MPANCTILLIALGMVFSCGWADRKLAERKEMAEYDRRVIWKGGKPQNCPTDYEISKFRRVEKSKTVHLLASNAGCTLFFQVASTKPDDGPLRGLDDLIGGKKNYVGTRSIITIDGVSKVSNTQMPLEFGWVGWGFRITWKVPSPARTFQLYMRPGVEADPFDPIR